MKTVYLLTKKGPIAYSINGRYLELVGADAPTRRGGRRKGSGRKPGRPKGSKNKPKASKSASPRKPRPSEIAAKKAKKSGTQSSL